MKHQEEVAAGLYCIPCHDRLPTFPGKRLN